MVGGVQHFGTTVCKIPIGDDEFIKDWLEEKTEKVTTAILSTAGAFASRDVHALHSIIHYSLQNRIDYVLSTNRCGLTTHITDEVDKALQEAYKLCFGEDYLLEQTHLTDPLFTSDRLKLKSKHGGTGFRPTSLRLCFINTMNKVLPQLVSNDSHNGLWQSLESVLGKESFKVANHQSRWEHFHSTGSSIAFDMRLEWERIQKWHSDTISKAHIADSVTPPILNATINSFGHDEPHLQRDIVNHIAEAQVKEMEFRATTNLDRTDPRRFAFLTAHADVFSNSLLMGHPSRKFQFTNSEWKESVATHFGMPSLACKDIIGQPILNSRNNREVDQFGFVLKTAQWVKGGHIKRFHDDIVEEVVSQLQLVGIPHLGGRKRTCKHLFSRFLNNSDDITDETNQLHNGIIPDILVDGTIFNQLDNPSTFDGVKTLLDMKSLAPGITYHTNRHPVQVRARQVNTDYHRKARQIDRDLPGLSDSDPGPIERELRSYGHNGVVVGCAFGAFGECSQGFLDLRDLIVREKVKGFTEYLDIPTEDIKGLFLRKLSREWGFAIARGWARVLLEHRHSHVKNNPFNRDQHVSSPASEENFAFEFFNYSHTY